MAIKMIEDLKTVIGWQSQLKAGAITQAQFAQNMINAGYRDNGSGGWTRSTGLPLPSPLVVAPLVAGAIGLGPVLNKVANVVNPVAKAVQPPPKEPLLVLPNPNPIVSPGIDNSPFLDGDSGTQSASVPVFLAIGLLAALLVMRR